MPTPQTLSRRGLASMLVAVACFAAMAAFVKVGREHGLSTAETIVYRMAPGLPWILFELRMRGASLWPRRPVVTFTRCATGGVSMGTSFFAVQGLTLLQHTVLHLAQPVLVAVFSPFALRERLRGVALLALVLAAGGAAIVILPGHAVADVADVPLLFGLAGLTAAVFSALSHIGVRMATGRLDPAADRTPWIATLTAGKKREAPETIVLHFTLWTSIVAAVVGLVTGGFQALPASLSTTESLGIIAGMAGLGAAGQLLMSRAYARAPAPAVAMVGYAGIPISVAIDHVVWGSATSLPAFAGAALMLLAGALLLRAR